MNMASWQRQALDSIVGWRLKIGLLISRYHYFQILALPSGTSYPKRGRCFRKEKNLLAREIEDLKNPGDAIYIQDKELTEHYIGRQGDFEFNKDLEEIAVQWFRPVPKKMRPTIGIQDQHGAVRPVSISSITLVGAW